MRLAGNLKDLGLGEILQIISFSRKSGVLWLNGKQSSGNIILQDGKVIRAISTAIAKPFVELLVDNGSLHQDLLDKARATQESEGYTRSLCDILIQDEEMDEALMESLAKKLMEKIVESFFFWKSGNFVFELVDFEETPELLKDDFLQYTLTYGMNSQFLAMEGTRLQDESPNALTPETIGLPIDTTAEQEKADEIEPILEEPILGAPEEQFMDSDSVVDEAIAEMPDVAAKLSPDKKRELNEFDLMTQEIISEFEGDDMFQLAGPAGTEAGVVIEESKGLRLLREMLDELNKPLTMSEIQLLILRFCSEVLNRAVIFVQKKGNIVGLGQYGIELDGAVADVVVRKMSIPASEPSILQEAAINKDKIISEVGSGKWNDYIVNQLGGKTPKDVFVCPVLVGDKVALLLYGDNVTDDEPIGDTSSLEIFLAQTSIVLERIFLERSQKN